MSAKFFFDDELCDNVILLDLNFIATIVDKTQSFFRKGAALRKKRLPNNLLISFQYQQCLYIKRKPVKYGTLSTNETQESQMWCMHARNVADQRLCCRNTTLQECTISQSRLIERGSINLLRQFDWNTWVCHSCWDLLIPGMISFPNDEYSMCGFFILQGQTRKFMMQGIWIQSVHTRLYKHIM